MHTALDFVLFLIAVIMFGFAFITALLGRPGHPALMPAGATAFSLAFLIAAWPG